MRRYRVKAVQREGHDGRNRSGRRFSSAHWTILEEHELTGAILKDDLLIVKPILDGEGEDGEPLAPAGEQVLVIDATALESVSTELLAGVLAVRGFVVFPMDVEAEALISRLGELGYRVVQMDAEPVAPEAPVFPTAPELPADTEPDAEPEGTPNPHPETAPDATESTPESAETAAMAAKTDVDPEPEAGAATKKAGKGR